MNVDEVIQKFFREPTARGRSGNVSFDGGALWSYGMKIAWHNEGKLFQVSPFEDVSVTTNRHIRKLRGYGAVALPLEATQRQLKIDQYDFVDGGGFNWNDDRTKHANWWKISRAGKLDTYLLCASVKLFQVPHYHQLETEHYNVWLRTLSRPRRAQLESLWQFMLLNPTGRRPQRRLKKAFAEDRLAQRGHILLERLPDVRFPRDYPNCMWQHRLGLSGASANITKVHPTDPELFLGTLNRRRVAPKGVAVRIHPYIVPDIRWPEDPVSLWDIDRAMLGRLE
jgi:hypothetical protein